MHSTMVDVSISKLCSSYRQVFKLCSVEYSVPAVARRHCFNVDLCRLTIKARQEILFLPSTWMVVLYGLCMRALLQAKYNNYCFHENNTLYAKQSQVRVSSTKVFDGANSRRVQCFAENNTTNHKTHPCE